MFSTLKQKVPKGFILFFIISDNGNCAIVANESAKIHKATSHIYMEIDFGGGAIIERTAVYTVNICLFQSQETVIVQP